RSPGDDLRHRSQERITLRRPAVALVLGVLISGHRQGLLLHVKDDACGMPAVDLISVALDWSHGINPRIQETMMTTSHASSAYDHRFHALLAHRRSFSYPCDAAGHVDMDSLSERALNNYLYARALMGFEV